MTNYYGEEVKRRKLSKPQRKEIYDKFGGHCAYCGCEITLEQLRVDHFEPLHLGGADEPGNMFPACHSCNHRKGTESIEEFRHSVEQFHSVLMRDSVTYKNAVRFGQVVPVTNPVVFYFELFEVIEEIEISANLRDELWDEF